MAPKDHEPFMTMLLAICEAVCARDPERAAAAMQTHLNKTAERIQDFLREASRR